MSCIVTYHVCVCVCVSVSLAESIFYINVDLYIFYIYIKLIYIKLIYSYLSIIS